MIQFAPLSWYSNFDIGVAFLLYNEEMNFIKIIVFEEGIKYYFTINKNDLTPTRSMCFVLALCILFDAGMM